MLRNLLLATAVLAVSSVGVVGGIGSSRAAQPGSAEPCPDRLDGQTPSLTCECTGAAARAGGSVWGSDVYTADSALCRAALHAGVIGEDGGIINVREAPGRGSYPAVNRNGVSSSSWASYPRSITFRGERVASRITACPDRLDASTPSLTCECSDVAVGGGGTVWGSTFYTADSALCRAALHAGVVGEEGGVVEVREAPGRGSYPAVNRNGVSSASWASYPRSITFRSRSNAPE